MKRWQEMNPQELTQYIIEKMWLALEPVPSQQEIDRISAEQLTQDLEKMKEAERKLTD